MYYPIIDKLKQVMDEIGQGGGGSAPLIIEGGMDTETGNATWTGNINDIHDALDAATPVYFHMSVYNIYYLIPIVYGNRGGPAFTSSIVLSTNIIGGYRLNSDNTVTISTITIS